MSGLLERIVARRRASASSRLGPPSETGAPYPNGVPYPDGEPPEEPTIQVNGSARADAPARDLQPIIWPPPAGAGDPSESAQTSEPTDFAEPEAPDPEATLEFGALAVEQVEAPGEAAPAAEDEAPGEATTAAERWLPAEPGPTAEAPPSAEAPPAAEAAPAAEPGPAAEDWLPPLEPAAIAPEPPVAAPVAAPPAAQQPLPQSPPVETETEPDSGAEPESEPAAPDAAVETAPDAAPENEALPRLEPEPRFRERGRMRRRARYLRRLREVQLRDIGGLVLELHRFGRERPDLVLAKVAGAAETDLELRALERALGEQQPFRELRVAGIGGACDRCGAVHGSTDRFCATCGELLHEDDPDDAGEPTAEPDGPGA